MNREDRYDSLIQFYAQIHGLNWEPLKRQMLAESGAHPRIVSSSGAIGLFQLMPETAKELRVDPWNPEENISGGIAYMAQKIAEVGITLGDVVAAKDDIYRFALAAYNAGFSHVREALRLLRAAGTPPSWEPFLGTLKKAGADTKQVAGYIAHILPSQGGPQ